MDGYLISGGRFSGGRAIGWWVVDRCVGCFQGLAPLKKKPPPARHSPPATTTTHHEPPGRNSYIGVASDMFRVVNRWTELVRAEPT